MGDSNVVKALRQEAFEAFMLERRLTDLGNAGRLVDRHGDDLRYCSGLAWLIWDGRKWAVDENLEIHRRAHDTILEMQSEIGDIEEGDLRKKFEKWAKVSESNQRIKSMIEIARADKRVSVSTKDLDSNPMMLNVLNGTLDLHSGKLLKARREDLITRMVPIPFDIDAEAPRWHRFLDEILPAEIQLFLQRLMGYSLTGDVREQKLAILWGDGANGKSTFVRAVQDVLGPDYTTTAGPGLLIKGQRHPNILADLRGQRIVFAHESGEGQRMNMELVKHATGGDVIKARRMYGEFFEFMPSHQIILLTNHKPVVPGDDHAIWRRLLLVPFLERIPEDQQEKALDRILAKEAPGILRWMVEGCLEWQRIGLDVPSQ